MRGDNLADLMRYAPRMLQELRTIPLIADVNSDQQNRGLQAMVQYDRDTAARFGISPQLIDNTLYDAFGQRQVSTMYSRSISITWSWRRRRSSGRIPQFLHDIYVKSPSGTRFP